jgi:DNA polymerase-3 subunit epsilon
LSSDIYIVLDLETTGLDSQLEGILEIAAVKLEGGVETALYHTFTRPDAEISEASEAIHGITAEMVANAPSPAAVLDDVLAFLGTYPLVAHNAPFDIQFLNRALALAGKAPLANPVFDTLEMARELFPEQRSLKLESLCKLLGHEASDFHRAVDDARHLAAVFPKLLKLHEQKQAWYQEQFTRIEHVARRYEALNRLIEDMQSELGDQRRILSRYFQEHPDARVSLPGGDELIRNSKELWDYDLNALRPHLAAWGLHDRFLKLDRPRLERWLAGSRLNDEQKLAIATTRLFIGQNYRISRTSGPTGGAPRDMLE